MLEIRQKVREIRDVDSRSIPPELLTATEPYVLKGLVRDWPFVKAGNESLTAAGRYLLSFYSDKPVGIGCGPSGIAGRLFYNDDMSAFNFDQGRVHLSQVLNEILRYESSDAAPTYYVGSTPVDVCLPGFRAENDLDLGDRKPLVSIWLGNRTRVAAHWDLPDNLACCAVGRRRFTLFPPDQIKNLYVGPLDVTPAGREISLVDFHDPDFERFPGFREAIEAAQVAELEAGDALFIPSMWWHHVEGLDALNVLINYWWRQSPDYMGTPVNALNLALITIRDLPAEQRKVWQDLFQHYVFAAADDDFAHIPEESRGILGPIDEEIARATRDELCSKLSRRGR